MQRLLLLVFFCLCIQFTYAQVQSNNYDNKGLIAKEYAYDIHYLTVEHLRNTNHPDKQLIRIPKIHSDSVLTAFAAIFNTGDKLQADSVFDKYCVHENFAPITSIAIQLDPAVNWTSNWGKDNYETGNNTLDNLLKLYGYTVDREANYPTLISNQLINRFALCDSIEKLSGIVWAVPSGLIRFGITYESITYYKTNDVAIVNFIRPFRLGGYNAHGWTYTIDENCTVSLEDTVYYLNVEPLEAYPTPTNCNISSKIAKNILAIYPNPTTGNVMVRTGIDGIIEIYTLSGQRLKKYISYKGYTPIDLSDLANGIHLVRHIAVNGKSEIQKIIKD